VIALTGAQARAAAAKAAAALVFGALAIGIAPDPVVSVDVWAAQSRVLGKEEANKSGPWRHENAPHLVEIMQCMSLSHPSREVIFKKSAQVGGTQAGINLFGTIACHMPVPMITVLPTDGEVKKYVELKLQPAIDNSRDLAAKVFDQKSRDNDGSTTRIKKYFGGFNLITGATSSAGLQMISARVLLLEEVSEYPFDAGGRGDPVDQALARTIDYTRNRKVCWISTPGEKGSCRISKKYDGSDQRLRYLPCPHCGAFQRLEFENLKWESDVVPHRAYFVCQANGCVIDGKHQEWMIARGVWLKCFAAEEGSGDRCPGMVATEADLVFGLDGHHARSSGHREPGFSIWKAYSLSVPWDDIVHEWLEAKGKPLSEKTFMQQSRGEAWEAKGDAPDYLKLFARRRMDLVRGIVPPGCLFITAAIDVQGNRFEWAAYGWGIGKKSWLIDKGVIPADTSQLASYAQLDAVITRRYHNALGREFSIEATAIDTGFNTQAVYAWARRHAYSGRVLAVDGRAGWSALPLGTPVKVDVTFAGEKLKGGVMLWPVGTWQLKSEFYSFVRLTIEDPLRDGIMPPGFVHLPIDDVDEAYCRQLTAEYLVTHERTDKRGQQIQEWVRPKDQPNEALDIRIYAAAMAVHLGIDTMTPEQWQRLAAERGAPPEKAQQELSLWQGTLAPPVPVAEPPKPAPQQPAAAQPEPQRQFRERHSGYRTRH